MRRTLEDYRFVQRYPVHWGEMDAARHVNNLVYLRWAESARIAYLEQIGLGADFSGQQVGPILGWQDCKYIFPLTFPDTVIVGTRTSEMLDDRMILECGMFSERHQRIASISQHHILPYDYNLLKKVLLPGAWTEAVERFQKSEQ
ncbi:MAG: acyl-CoA thioesterase [Bacteroidota bacterium]